LRLAARPLLGLGERLRLELDARGAGEILQDLHEGALLDLFEKADHIAFLAAPEAMEVVAGLIYVKRRCFFAVERAQALPTPRTRPLELHMPLHHLDDVRPFSNVVDLLPGN